MLSIRRLHGYIGLFIAPSVLFFAFSGACQVFNLHEAHGSYKPPALIETLGHLHKDQVLSAPDHDHGPPPPAASPSDDDDHTGPPKLSPHYYDDDRGPKASTLVLKWFFEAVAAGLAISTVFGLWLGLRFTKTPRLSWGLLIAGIILPILIVVL